MAKCKKGLDSWRPRKNATPYFGLSRDIDPVRFNQPYSTITFKTRAIWYMIRLLKRFL